MAPVSVGQPVVQPDGTIIVPIASAFETAILASIPGLAADRSTSGNSARLGLTYYFYPDAHCRPSTCQLMVGFISSANGGMTWSAPTKSPGR
jgi:hypothetical protein